MDDRLVRGVELFNGEFYFDAHDVWEDLWRDLSGPDRIFVQGLIQAAVGLYHRENGNLRGARSQITRSLDKLAGFTPGHHGIDTAGLVQELRGCLVRVEQLTTGGVPLPDPPDAPAIRPLPVP
jgi:predicted metal-dependent hydrolase